MNALPELALVQIDGVIKAALAEDLGSAGDITTDAIVSPGTTAVARISARQPGRLAGIGIAARVFERLDPAIEITQPIADGTAFEAGATLLDLRGSARALLTGERTALNILGRMCGIATATATAVAAVAGTDAKIACTRKTMPGLRAFDKYAVRAGGGANHRFGLYDAVLIKDNHIAVAGGLVPAVEAVRARAGHMVKIEVEVDTLEQLADLIPLGVDAVLLDNMDADSLAKAVEKVGGTMQTEASGGITPESVRMVAETGVDLISIGWLTHSVTNLDVGLDFDQL